MSTEKSLARLVRAKLLAVEPRGHLERVENLTGSGMPDLNYCLAGKEGWIEFKYIRELPKQLRSPVRIKHYTMEQRAWIRCRHQAGGRVFLLLEVDIIGGPHFLLFRAPEAVVLVGKVRWELLQNASCDIWHRNLDGSMLMARLAQ